ncbi:NAD(P)H-dependent oxidoreductase [Streptomyces sp. NPDC048290]|uniref:FMN-dependent NADH-azoreductase n=1 Tax=Streptomyces sp. NPDC048290 TaxID=3155811 RepID=UPI003423B2D3
MTLLHIDSSADTPADSVSRRLTGRFLTAWTARRGGPVRHRDLAADPVPPLTAAYTALGRRVEREGMVPPDKVPALLDGPAEEREWALTRPLIDELLAARTLLLGVPMYNLAVPASLKAWIDRVTFPGAFTDPDSGESLLRGTRVVAVLARGGGYGPGSPREHDDFQAPYLRTYFAGLGVTDLHLVTAELTRVDLMPHLTGLADLAARSLAGAEQRITELATA